MKYSLISTFFNEEASIEGFLESVFRQSLLPDQMIFVDGGSTDKTVATVKDFIKTHKNKIDIRLAIKNGNRAVGRNEAIRQAKGDIILCVDAGCILDRNWVKEITAPFQIRLTDVVAGYYDGKSTTIFQKCLVPYVLVMQDRLDPETFLPATRSVAFTKMIWEKVGGFDEKYSHNEDFVFARELKKQNANIIFARNAIVHWIPRKTFKEAYVMFRRFAQGDAESGIWRPKVVFLLFRYSFALILLLVTFAASSRSLFYISLLFFSLYILWSIMKNYRYVNDFRAFLFLPLLQFTADFAVLDGTVRGFITAKK